jgi:hypothetical protein
VRLTNSPRSQHLAKPLPNPFTQIDKRVKFYRSQTSLTVAASGVGKSQLWANLAQRMGIPSVYWSADSGRETVTVRTLAMWTGYTTEQAELYRRDPTWAHHWEQALQRSRHIDWAFDTPIKAKAVGERLWAFAEKHGEFPHLFVVDNLSNTVENIGDEFAEQKQVMTQMQQLARETGTHIAMLHHAKGEYESGTRAIPKTGSMNNLFKLPEVGLTIHRPGGVEGKLAVSVVKNRSGRDDPLAEHPIVLDADLGRATIYGYEGR